MKSQLVSSSSVFRLRMLLALSLVTSGILNMLPSSVRADRTPWTTSRMVGSPEKPKPFVLERVFPKLNFVKPVELVYEKTSGRYYMIEVGGRITSFSGSDADASTSQIAKGDLVIDLKKHYPALFHTFGLAFHPQFETNGYVYIVYVPKRKSPGGTHLSRFTVTTSKAGLPEIDISSEQLLLTWISGGHNGGKLLFGKDGMLYVSTGDGGPASPPDQLKTGQDISDLLSSVLRIDVDRRDGDKNYAIPHDNPFVNHKGARPEVWAYGLRNPWKMSFDSKSGDLWVGDVGWELWELIFKVERGGNYGWSIVEGSQSVLPLGKRGPTPIQSPVVEHPHTEAKSITGGYVYRGTRLKDLYAKYVYGDYITGKVWAIPADAKSDVQLTRQSLEKLKVVPVELADTSIKIISFAEAKDGDLLLLDYEGGMYRLKPNPELSGVRHTAVFPTRLSATGLFSSVKDYKLADGVAAYEINAGLWSDHATSARFIAVPGKEQIDVFTQKDAYKGWFPGRWRYPAGTVIGRTYFMEMKRGEASTRKRLETQLLHLDGEKWRGYSYVWNDEQTEATLAPRDGANQKLEVRDAAAPLGLREQLWHTASRTECMMCHNEKSGIILGFVPEQLHQLSGKSELLRLRSLGLFAKAAQTSLLKRAMAGSARSDSLDRTDKKEITNRARTWLHVNCAHCHQLGSGGSTPIDLRFQTPYERTRLAHTVPAQGDFGLPDANIVVMGKPFSSVLLYRIATTGIGHMPHMGSKFVDRRGVDLIWEWISQGGAAQDSNSALAKEPAHLHQLKDREQSAKLDVLLGSVDGALGLVLVLDLVEDSKLRSLIIQKGASHSDVRVSGLFQRFVPAKLRRQVLGESVKPASILSLTGNAKRGERLMHAGGAVTCFSCHQVGSKSETVSSLKGLALGPNLAGIGSKYKRSEILMHILEPSKVVEDRFASWMVQLADGDDLIGFIESGDKKKIKMKLLTGTMRVVDVQDIEEMRQLKRSSMPERLLSGLTAQEAADLLDYLAGLRKQ